MKQLTTIKMRIIPDQAYGEIKNILAKIQGGTFAKSWILENTGHSACVQFDAPPR